MPNTFKPILGGDNTPEPIQPHTQPVKPVVVNPVVTSGVVEKPVDPSSTTQPVVPSKQPINIKRKQPLTLEDEKIIKVSQLPPDYPPKYFKPY